VVYRDSLLSLLPFPKDPLKKRTSKIENAELLQNVPNPCNSNTSIYFKVTGLTDALIRIYDCWGRLEQEIPLTDLKDGTQKVNFNTSTLPAGVYQYSLFINNNLTSTRKMVVIK
jgi:hypothetical protein